MGEFINAVESIQITDNISSENDGTKSMQSIKPKLGYGLGENKDQNRGKIFPQFKLNNGKYLDENFCKKPILLYSSKIKKNMLNKINSIKSNQVKGLSSYLKKSNSKALIVRPDRFILASLQLNKNFDNFLKKNINFLI